MIELIADVFYSYCRFLYNGQDGLKYHVCLTLPKLNHLQVQIVCFVNTNMKDDHDNKVNAVISDSDNDDVCHFCKELMKSSSANPAHQDQLAVSFNYNEKHHSFCQ